MLSENWMELLTVSGPPDEVCRVVDGEVNDEEWDKNGNKNVADNDDTHILVKWESL